MKAKIAISALFMLSSVVVGAKADQVRFGVDPTYPPFSYKDKAGELEGFDIELGNAICASMHSECVWVVNEFDGLVPGLKAKKYDGIMSTMQATPERLKQIDFSDGLYVVQNGLVSRKDKPLVFTKESLRGKSIGVEQGTLPDIYANKVLSAWGAVVVSYQSIDQVYIDLVNGRLDASLQETVQAQLAFLSTPQGKDYIISDRLKDASVESPVAVGIEKGNEPLKQRLNAAIKNINESGEFERIKLKYFKGHDFVGN